MSLLTDRIYALLIELSNNDPKFKSDRITLEMIESATSEQKAWLYRMLYAMNLKQGMPKHLVEFHGIHNPPHCGKVIHLHNWIQPSRKYLVTPVKTNTTKCDYLQRIKKQFWNFYYTCIGTRSAAIVVRPAFQIEPLSHTDNVSGLTEIRPNIYVRPEDYAILFKGSVKFSIGKRNKQPHFKAM